MIFKKTRNSWAITAYSPTFIAFFGLVQTHSLLLSITDLYQYQSLTQYLKIFSKKCHRTKKNYQLCLMFFILMIKSRSGVRHRV